MAKIPPTCRPDIGHVDRPSRTPHDTTVLRLHSGLPDWGWAERHGAIPVRQHGAVTGREPPVTLRSPARGPPPLRQHGTRPVV